MNALSIRNRLEYAVIGLAIASSLIGFAYYMIQTEGETAGFAALICSLFGVAIGRQLIFVPPSIGLTYWVRDFFSPARVGTFEGKAVYERWDLVDFRRIYDHTGKLIATEQTIDWSSTDMDWNPGDPEDIQIIINRLSAGERLSWLALLRSPKLPAGPMAEIIDPRGDIIGRTTYNIL